MQQSATKRHRFQFSLSWVLAVTAMVALAVFAMRRDVEVRRLRDELTRMRTYHSAAAQANLARLNSLNRFTQRLLEQSNLLTQRRLEQQYSGTPWNRRRTPVDPDVFHFPRFIQPADSR